MKAILQKDHNSEFRFWGGDLMEKVANQKPVKHYKELAFMGFLEVAMNIRTILKNIKICKEDIKNYQPDVLILVDYPGFNLRIAEFAKSIGIKVVYYISPQLWAWKEGRVETIKKYVDEMLVILPFEKDFYKKHQVNAHFVGHPLLDAISDLAPIDAENFKKEYGLNDKEIIALLPGSREQEVEKMLALMLSVRDSFKNYQFVIAGAPSQEYSFYQQFITSDNIKFLSNKTYDLLQHATAALVTSGTATLETALFKVPEVVCYKGNWISYQIAKRIITLKYISLVNLIMDKEVVTELIQDDCNTKRIASELQKILEPEHRKIVLENYRILEEKLGGKGASSTTAKLIVADLK